MNHRLLTPAIILVSFGAALTAMGWHTGRSRAALAAEPTAAPGAPSAPARALPDPTSATDPPAAHEPPAEQAAPARQPSPDEAPVVLEDKASEGFLDARDRAAEHGARSH